MMSNRGHRQFASGTYMSRLANSYTWAAWDEVVGLAEVLAVAPEELGAIYAT